MSKSLFSVTDHFIFGFGDKTTTFEDLSKRFPLLSWAQLKQTHSDIIVESASATASAENLERPLIEADAHFTTTPNLGLVVKTADCVPVLIACESVTLPRAVCAIHAGWRGVRSGIVSKSVRLLLEKGYAPTKMKVMIGPHIRQESFDVGLDVAQDLFAAAKAAGLTDPSSVVFSHPEDSSKRKIDLESIVRQQLVKFQVPTDRIETFPVDTMSSHDWSSYRRDSGKAGRNLSFVAINGVGSSAKK